MNIIITIPAYNEEKTIGPVIDEIRENIDQNKYNYKILVVNDGSKDKTAEIAKSKGAIVYSHKRNFGLAETFKTEMKKCLELEADLIVHTDADRQYMAKDIPKLLNKIEQGYDLVLGSRFKGSIESMPLIKRIGNKAFSKVLSHITKVKITDGQTGFRAFTKDIAKLEINSYHTYTQEQLIRAAKNKFKIGEVPIDARKTRKSKLMKNPFEYAIKAWITILRVYRDYEPLKFFGIFGLIFFLGGIGIGIWLLSLLITQGKIGHVPSTILAMLLILTGIQFFSFGFMADMNRK